MGNRDRLAEAQDKLMVALDISDLGQAMTLVQQLALCASHFKIGRELDSLQSSERVVRLGQSYGLNFMLDGKEHDIQRTTTAVVRNHIIRGITSLTVHCSAGSQILQGVVDDLRRKWQELGMSDSHRPKVLGVTVLTGIDLMALHEIGVSCTSVEEQVIRLAHIAKASGLDGVIASGLEVRSLRREFGPDFLIYTPGIRLRGGEYHDQKRVVTAAEAISAGANIVIVGRPIIGANDPVEAANLFTQDIASVL